MSAATSTPPSAFIPWKSVALNGIAIISVPLVLLALCGLAFALSAVSYGVFKAILPDARFGGDAPVNISHIAAAFVCVASSLASLLLSCQMEGVRRKLLALPVFAAGYAIVLTASIAVTLGLGGLAMLETVGLSILLGLIALSTLIATVNLIDDLNVAQGGSGVSSGC